MGKLTEDQEKQLYKLLTQTPHDAGKWNALVKTGASDKDIRVTVAGLVGYNGRNDATGKKIIHIKSRPVLALWFGSHAVGVPTVKERDLIQEIREVFRIVSPETKTAMATDPTGLMMEVVGHPPVVAGQVPLFDYEVLDSQTAEEVKDHASRVKNLLGTMKLDAIEVGQRLRSVKEHLGRGQFDGWLAAEFGMSRDSADKFIQSAVFVEQNPDVKGSLDKFDRSAIYVLAAPSTPEPAVQEAKARAQSGEKITPTKAREIKKRHAPAMAKVGRQSDAGLKPKEPEITTAADEVEAAWNLSTILIQVKMLPHDGAERGRPVQILVRNDSDKPLQQFTVHDEAGGVTLRSDDLPPFKGPVGALLKKLYTEMPERIARANARLKAEKAKKAKAKAKPTVQSFPKPKGKKRGGK